MPKTPYLKIIYNWSRIIPLIVLSLLSVLTTSTVLFLKLRARNDEVLIPSQVTPSPISSLLTLTPAPSPQTFPTLESLTPLPTLVHFEKAEEAIIMLKNQINLMREKNLNPKIAENYLARAEEYLKSEKKDLALKEAEEGYNLVQELLLVSAN